MQPRTRVRFVTHLAWGSSVNLFSGEYMRERGIFTELIRVCIAQVEVVCVASHLAGQGLVYSQLSNDLCMSFGQLSFYSGE